MLLCVGQGVFFNVYSLFYLISPRHCHAFVGYLEEEAVKTYTHCLADIDQVHPLSLAVAVLYTLQNSGDLTRMIVPVLPAR